MFRRKKVIEDEEVEELKKYKKAAMSKLLIDVAEDIVEEIYKKVMNNSNFDEKHKLAVFEATVSVFCAINRDDELD
ncbi:hypothetical protein Asulf_00949 [Archaeoglobus sulfaticallidus PM70-1]|uniref:Uncharacterized protein n=1 Tax=Archaeoglobus sulfaticallidus PM70-1 TaxID=387631 RepID=N0BD68_9EURY|nr:hypothetical protein [Archaeoglobus sulfaticallidus]AGK60953.1 hypothetical protein Asulf_00949 [Archaeoglobus sulfaticallidus PM70-1]